MLLQVLERVLTPEQIPFLLSSLVVSPWVNDVATMPMTGPSPSGRLPHRVQQIGRRYASVFVFECFQLLYSPWWAPLSWWSRNYPAILMVAWISAGVVLSLRLALATATVLAKSLLGLLVVSYAVLLHHRPGIVRSRPG
jgi:hypothetical protein